MFIPVSAVIPTANRSARLKSTINSILQQSHVPAEMVLVDASEGRLPAIGEWEDRFERFRHIAATQPGAASQREQGVAEASHKFILFLDDDVDLKPDCLRGLWEALQADSRLGGVNAMIVNQRYQSPGLISRAMFTLMHGRAEKSFAGKVIGPAINLLPEGRDDLPEVVPVEWLNLGCTIYRRLALPMPVFDPIFAGYSLMEDLTLSLRVSQRGWKLANARTARIYHDSQPGEHKSNETIIAAMELRNRWYVTTKILRRTRFLDRVRLFLWELFSIVTGFASHPDPKNLFRVVTGKIRALRLIAREGVQAGPSRADSA